MKILAISATFPSVADPSRGVFVKERLKALAAIEGIDVRVLSPTPWFPPVKRFEKWYRWSQYPQQETFDGLLVDNPRYILPPKVGGYFHPQLMHKAIVRKVDRIRDEFPFDLIDAHYVYPAGSLAAMLGQRYDVPFVTTGRGEDMERFPDLPLVGNKIRWTLRHAAQCIGVSRQIADAMVQNGAQRTRTHVIPNGIDASKFHPKSQEECRQLLDLPTDRKIILSVGDRLELKGFHLMAEAMPAVLKQNPDALYIIVGGPGRFGRDHTPQIQSLIDEHQLHDSVRIAGPQPHDRLIDWYNAADLYATLSSREGSPNVLLEALACGTPAIGTAVGGIQDELQNEVLGLLIPERSAKEISKVANQALQRDWSRTAIAENLEERTWEATAQRVAEVLREAVLYQTDDESGSDPIGGAD